MEQEKKEAQLFKIDFSRVFKTWAIVDGEDQDAAIAFVKEAFDPKGDFGLEITAIEEITTDEADEIIAAANPPMVRPTLQ